DPIQSGGNTHLSSLFLQSNSIEIQNIILAHEELDQQSSLLTLLHTDVVPEIMGSVFKFFINSPQPSVRACALSSLAAISPTGDRSFFLPYLKDEDPACVGHAVIALSDDDDYRSLYFDEVSTVLHSKAISDDELENRSALHLITLLQDDHLLELLEFLLYSKQKEFREEMLSQLNSWALVSEEVRAMVESVRLEQDKFDLWDLPEQGLAGLELKAADSENASQTHSKLEMELPKERFKRVIAVNTILLTQDSSYQSRINDLLHDETDVNIRYRLQRAATELETRTSEPDSSHNSDNAQITKALDSKSVNTLKKAFKFIAQHRIETFFPRMLEVSRQQENPFFKQTLIYCISNFGTRYYRTLLDFLRDPDHEVVLDSIQATVATTGIDNWEVFPEFVRLTYHPHIPISSLAKEYVSTLDKEILVHLMESLIRSENSDQRYSAIYAIQALLIPFLEPLLKEVTQDRDPYVADCARVHFKNFCESLEIIDKPGDKPSKQKGDQSGESFKEILNNLEKKTETFELLEGLKKLEEAGVIVHRRIEALQSYCTNQCEEVRCAALKALGRIWPNEDRSWFGNYLEDESAKVAGCALLNLYRDQKSYSQSSDLVTKTLKRLITSPLPLDNILGIQCIAVLKDNQFLELLIFSLYNLVDRSEQLRNLAIDVIEEFCSISKDAERVMEQYRSDQGSFDQWQEEMGTEDLNSKHFEDELLRTFRSPQDSKKIEMIRHILKGEISFRPEILLPLLYEELEKNPEPEILVDLIKVIELIPEKEHWEALSPFLTHENPCVVAQTVESLCQLEDERVLDPVEDLINGDLCQDDQYLKVVGAMKFLRKKNPLLAYEFLEKLGLGNESTREYFVEFLPSFSSSQDRLIHYLLELLAQDMTLNVTRAVVAHLEKAPPRKIVPRVLKVFLGSQNEHATLEIYKYLSMYASRWNLDAVKTLARDAENPEKRELLYALLESIQTRCSGKQPGLVDEQ
ncbi:hypothetical protein HOF92_10065, partial [bacterium]|nr:hypothetical protein [bacterium]